MAITKVAIRDFLELPRNIPILDVRSPSEYAYAHIPGAHSFAIFDDHERHIIGTAYKQESREKAIRLGLDFFGKKMSAMVTEAEDLLKKNKIAGKEFRVHCWRGGMRSAAIAWLLDLYGFKVYLLEGGYKSYRHHVLAAFEKEYPLHIVGGYTGGNKTGLLHLMKQKGENVIDLEALAGHMGSAFGNLDNIPQPSQEQFENDLCAALEKAELWGGTIWLEGESQRIGTVNLPQSFFKLMRRSKVYFMDIGFEPRLHHIVKTYGVYPVDKLINATVRITKRLGGLETKTAVGALIENDVTTAFRILLKYYDKLYLKSTHDKMEGEREIVQVQSETTDPSENYQKILQHAK